MARRSKRQSLKAVSALLALAVAGLVTVGVVKIRHDYLVAGTELIGWAFVPLAILLGFTFPTTCKVKRTNRKACGNHYGALCKTSVICRLPRYLLRDQENSRHAGRLNRQRLPRPIERRFLHQIPTAEKPLPSYRMSGLTDEQLDELVARAEDFLEEPWDKEAGRPKALSLRDALIVTCGYMRNNITEEIWAEIFGVSQSCISRYIKFLTQIVCDATQDFRPSATEATEATRGAIALVDGTLWPCWSWSGAKDLWAGKYKTTGHGSLVITNYDGDILYVSTRSRETAMTWESSQTRNPRKS